MILHSSFSIFQSSNPVSASIRSYTAFLSKAVKAAGSSISSNSHYYSLSHCSINFEIIISFSSSFHLSKLDVSLTSNYAIFGLSDYKSNVYFHPFVSFYLFVYFFYESYFHSLTYFGLDSSLFSIFLDPFQASGSPSPNSIPSSPLYS